MVRLVMAQAAFHSRPYSSVKRRISSATAMLGWVSLSWKQFFSANWLKSAPCWLVHSLSASCRLAEARKYCWRRRSSLPFSLASLGYSTMVMCSAVFFAATDSE